MIKALPFLLLSTLLACNPAANAADPSKSPSSVETYFNSMHTAEKLNFSAASSVRASVVAEQYDRLIRHVDELGLTGLPKEDLSLLLRAARLALVYRPNDAVERNVAAVIGELTRRNEAVTGDHEIWYDAAIATRNFDCASSIKRLHPDIKRPAPPSVVDAIHIAANGIPAYTLTDDGHALSREMLPIANGRWLIIVSSPACGFSNRAASDLLHAIELQRRLAVNGVQVVWLQPVERRIDVDQARQWSIEHNGARLYWPVSQSDWPQIENWDTPTFYLIDRGNVIATTTGWRGGEISIDGVTALLDELTDSERAHAHKGSLEIQVQPVN